MGNCCGGAATVPSVPNSPSQPKHPHPPETAETNYQTPKSSSHVSSHASPTVLLSHGSNEKYARPAVQDDHQRTSTLLPPQPRAATPLRVRSQGWESSQPHREVTGNLPFCGDVFASQNPRRQETVPQITRSHQSGRKAWRMNSENILGNGHPPQFGSLLTPGQAKCQSGDRI